MARRTVIKAISRDQIIKAIKTEKLTAGTWVENSELNVIGDCGVCAVGATLRSIGLYNKALDDITYEQTTESNVDLSNEEFPPDEQIIGRLKDKDYLSALSMKFEWLADDAPTRTLTGRHLARVRKELVKFVRQNFPKRVKLLRPVTVEKRPSMAELRSFGIDLEQSDIVFV